MIPLVLGLEFDGDWSWLDLECLCLIGLAAALINILAISILDGCYGYSSSISIIP
jgi:hypothetical protein